MIPLTVPEVRRLIAATVRPSPPGHAIHWSGWTRRHQATARWFHQRTRLARDPNITLNALVIQRGFASDRQSARFPACPVSDKLTPGPAVMIGRPPPAHCA